jgi:type I restriction enzyme S subunit
MTEGPYKLPEGWRWVRLGEVFRLRNGRFIRGGDLSTEGGVPVYGANGLLGFTATPLLSQGKTIVIGRVGACGAVNVVEAPCWISDNAMYVSQWNTNCDIEYIALALRKIDLSRLAKKGAQPSISQEAVYSALIPLPPLAEQRRIVARIEELMDRVREARRLRQEAQKDAERLWQSVLAQTFPRPGSDLPEGWRWVRLGEVCTLIEVGFAFRKKGAPEGDLLHLRPYNIGEDGTLVLSQRFYLPSSLGLARHKMLQPGDVLFNNTNSVELVGKTALVREPLEAAFSNHITLLRSDTTKAEGAWIALALQTLWRQGFFANLCNKWIGQAGINTETLKSVLIPLPPLAEQRRIVAHLEAVQERLKALKEAQAATEAELKRLEQAILEKAFRGEL